MNPSKHAKAGSKSSKTANDAPSDNAQKQIALRAYYKSEARGYAPGYELTDWLAAEAEINSAAKGI